MAIIVGYLALALALERLTDLAAQPLARDVSLRRVALAPNRSLGLDPLAELVMFHAGSLRWHDGSHMPQSHRRQEDSFGQC
ncbi:MAG TPA: hypothetical protein VN213_16440 [Solirubrobacteraceae bacterium]|nr:hypothetical protein [Solirubrobacteraceae bacterium]